MSRLIDGGWLRRSYGAPDWASSRTTCRKSLKQADGCSSLVLADGDALSLPVQWTRREGPPQLERVRCSFVVESELRCPQRPPVSRPRHRKGGTGFFMIQPRFCTVCLARDKKVLAKFVAQGPGGFAARLHTLVMEWYECGDHDPTDNVADVTRSVLVPLEDWCRQMGLDASDNRHVERD